jgi:hypothetical protein
VVDSFFPSVVGFWFTFGAVALSYHVYQPQSLNPLCQICSAVVEALIGIHHDDDFFAGCFDGVYSSLQIQ